MITALIQKKKEERIEIEMEGGREGGREGGSPRSRTCHHQLLLSAPLGNLIPSLRLLLRLLSFFGKEGKELVVLSLAASVVLL